MAFKNVPLIVRRAEIAALNEQLKDHRKNCAECKSPRGACAELAAGRAELAAWFDPNPGDQTLF
jgi:hypothetical protein